MNLGPPPPHQRPPMSSGLPGSMGSLSLGPPSSNGLSNGGGSVRPVLKPPLSTTMPFGRSGNAAGGIFPPSKAAQLNGSDVEGLPKSPGLFPPSNRMPAPMFPPTQQQPPSSITTHNHPSSTSGMPSAPTVQTPGGHPPKTMTSPMGMPPNSGSHTPREGMSTPNASGMMPRSAPNVTPMSTATGPSTMPPMSGVPSNTPAGMPPTMSAPGGPMSMGPPSTTGMPPMTPVGSSSMNIPTMSTPGGPSPMGMPPMSTPGPSPMGMPPMSTAGGPSPMGIPPMSTPGPSPMGMPPMSTPGPSLMGIPPMSTAGGPSPMGMPPMSTPGGPSSMGIPPMSTAGGPSPMGMPPMSTPGGPSIGMPPMSTPGPSTMGMPPMSTPRGPSSMGMPPMSTPGPSMGMPPMSTPGPSMGMPPNSMAGGQSPMPPMSMAGGQSPMPPMSMAGGQSPMPPMSTAGAPLTPGGPSSMMMPPPMGGGMPSISTPNGPGSAMLTPNNMRPMSTPSPMGMPPMSAPGGPSSMGMRPPMVSTPGGGPPSSLGMPPMSSPMGMPPTGPPSTPMGMSTPGRFPGGYPQPMSTPGGYPPMSTPGGFPPGPNAGGGMPPPPSGGMNNATHGGPLRPMGGYPGPMQPGGYPAQGPGQQQPFGGSAAVGKRTLDPDNMPSPITVMEEDSKNNSGYFDTKEKGLVPPLVTTKFVVRDCGNASPRYVRSTMYHVPATPDLMKQAGVPFGLVMSPLATVGEGESEPAVTDFGPAGPVRCTRCKAYMCPFMQFVDGGRRFQCIFCKATSEVPQEYFQHLDHNGMRLDHYQRPELCMGTYEVLATKEYCRESLEPLNPGIIFAIDVSYPMIKEGIVGLICQNMKDLLALLPVDGNCPEGGKSKMKVGFMAYDNKINFYNIKGVLTQPQQMTVSDVHDMFVPLVDGFMVDVAEAEAVIDALMEQIPVLFGETRETETMLGPVIQAGKEAFKAAKCAGKLVVFHHNLPICDAPGKLKNRDDRKLLNTEKEKSVLSPQSKFYNELGQECVSVGCSVDLFLFNNAYIDVATMSQVCRLTGGQIYKYTYFQAELDGERFLSDLRHNIRRPVVFDAIMRVRTSTGVRPVDFFGSFYMANSTDTELASINSDMSIACEIKHDDKLTDEDGVYIQVALLFTSCAGQRRLRIINLSLNTGTNLADMYRSCDLDTIVNFTAKQSISRLMESNPKSVKESLINNCAQILACYRRNCASTSSIGQLILPECMKLLPLYTNCLIKSDALSGGQDVGCDERAFLMSLVSSMDVKTSVSFFYPALIPIHDVDPAETHVPKIIRCSYEKIRDDGVYLLENGLHIFMYIGLGVNPAWVRDIFGVESPAQIDIEKVRFDMTAGRDNPLYKRVTGIIAELRGVRGRYMRLFFVRPKDKLDVLFKHFLCEDRTGHDGNFSYVDFLCFMHKEIRALLG